MTRAALGALLFLSSAGTIAKYAGTPAALVSLPILVLAAGVYRPVEREALRLNSRQVALLAGAGLVALTVVLVVVYPHANAHTPGSGSDRDDAANLGAHRLLAGEYPYGPVTYLGNPISQLPGALALAAPFYAAFGSSAYANVVWLAVLAALVGVVAGALELGPAVVATTLVLSPGLVREYLTGGDLIANTVYVAAAAAAVVRFAPRRVGLLAAAALGVALASRANFALILIPLGALLVARHGARAAGLLAVTAVTSSALVAVAFARPAGREALRVSDHLSALGRTGAALTVAAAVALALLLAARTRRWSTGVVLAQAAAVQAVFPIALVVNAGDFAPLVSGYGVPALLLFLPYAAASFFGSCEPPHRQHATRRQK